MIHFSKFRKTTLDELYRKFDEVIEIASKTSVNWPERAKASCRECINAFQQFRRGEINTDDVKARFKLLTVTVGNEVVCTDAETFAIYCLAGVAHAAAHLGHLATAMSRKGKANRQYVMVQKNYVMLGIYEAKMFAQKARRAFDKERANQLVA